MQSSNVTAVNWLSWGKHENIHSFELSSRAAPEPGLSDVFWIVAMRSPCAAPSRRACCSRHGAYPGCAMKTRGFRSSRKRFGRPSVPASSYGKSGTQIRSFARCYQRYSRGRRLCTARSPTACVRGFSAPPFRKDRKHFFPWTKGLAYGAKFLGASTRRNLRRRPTRFEVFDSMLPCRTVSISLPPSGCAVRVLSGRGDR